MCMCVRAGETYVRLNLFLISFVAALAMLLLLLLMLLRLILVAEKYV